ncbi:MAG: DNA gyrase subunit A [Acholeplasmataceae bacterium]
MEDYKDNNQGNIKEINISTEMKTSFLSYAMSVIVSRALPDVRDGLKPVQRRILYAMNDLGMTYDKPHKKSARIVGEVIGKYHPHGDSSVYEAMVRMAQSFSYRMPLVDGHGNFGSIDGDGAAAMRYTEARLSKIASELIRDIDKKTVDYIDNYDGSELEPAVLPARYPNLLVNGASGIAVGMATEIPPHNLGEVIDGLLAYMDNNDITLDELMEHIKGPDFPTGGQILGLTGLRNAYETGRGIIAVRANAEIISHKNKNSIIITEIPYQVNKTRLIEKIADIAKEKIVEGITDLRDESNRNGIRIVIELKRDVNPDVMLNNLYKHTQLQTSFGINTIALVNGQPQQLPLKNILRHYLDHQVEIILRRSQFELEKAEARTHILEGLLIALHDIDRAIALIKQSKTAEEAREALTNEYQLTEIQARAILDMRLQRLTGLEIAKITEEAEELAIRIEYLRNVIGNDERKYEIIREELMVIKESYPSPRLSEINLHDDLSIENEDLIPVEDVIITVTNAGYFKRMKVDEYKNQNRGGVGMSGIKVHEDDFVEHILMTSTHDYHLFFTNKGRVYKMKGYEIPQYSRQSKGIPIVQKLNFDEDEKLASLTSVKNFEDENKYLTFVTKKGVIKRTRVSDYQNIRTNGIIAITLREDDELLDVRSTDGNKEILLGASNGKAIRFKETDVRTMGRTAGGVRGMDIGKNQEVVGVALITHEEQEILVITENGFGKRTKVYEYRTQKRGGKGVKTLNITDKNGKLSTLRAVTDEDDLIVVTDKGVVIRTHVDQISQTKRATQGVRVIKLKLDHKVATIALVPREDDKEELEGETTNFQQEAIDVETAKKAIEAVDMEPEMIEEDEEEIVKIDSLFSGK